MQGSVTISIKDFDNLRGAEEQASQKSDMMHRAAKELEVFLSFLVTREHIQESMWMSSIGSLQAAE